MRTVPTEMHLDRACKQCGGPIVVNRQRGVPFKAYAKEEFCSSICCRKFYGVVMASDPKVKADA